MPILVFGFDRLFVVHSRPDQQLNLLYRLDLRPDYTHSISKSTTRAGNFNGSNVL